MTFHYDNDGLLVKVTKAPKNNEFTSNRNEQIVYSDYEFDEMGNWIKRKVTWSYETKFVYVDDSDGEWHDKWEKSKDACMEERIITYYRSKPNK